jgi:hypothetical protein
MEDNKPVMDEVLLQDNKNLQIVQRALEGALHKVFGEQTDAQRFIDTKRIPLICKDLENINKNIEDIKDSIASKEGDHEARVRLLEVFMNTQAGKASQSSVYGAYIIAIVGILVGVALHFWK